MEEFKLESSGNYIRIEIDEVFNYPGKPSLGGGYDTKSFVDINIDGFKVSSIIWVQTYEYYDLYHQLLKTNLTLSGTAYFRHVEENLEFQVVYLENGHVSVIGTFRKHDSGNILYFNMGSDQSYIQSTLKQLAVIANKYGGFKGIE